MFDVTFLQLSCENKSLETIDKIKNGRDVEELIVLWFLSRMVLLPTVEKSRIPFSIVISSFFATSEKCAIVRRLYCRRFYVKRLKGTKYARSDIGTLCVSIVTILKMVHAWRDAIFRNDMFHDRRKSLATFCLYGWQYSFRQQTLITEDASAVATNVPLSFFIFIY